MDVKNTFANKETQRFTIKLKCFKQFESSTLFKKFMREGERAGERERERESLTY